MKKTEGVDEFMDRLDHPLKAEVGRRMANFVDMDDVKAKQPDLESVVRALVNGAAPA